MVTQHTRVTWTLICLFALSSAPSAWAGAPTDQLRAGIDRVIKTIRDPDLSGDQRTAERRAAISKVADEIFDFTETAKRALGQHWAQRTPAEREQFVRLFTGLVQRTYVSKVDQYNSDMTFQGDTVDGDQATVRTTLILSKGGEMSLNYRMHQAKDRWQVYDINIDGISLVANYRTQFNKIIRTESYESLVAKLKSQQTDFPQATPVSTGRAER
jgi:phospholipid transport system substrate-binding protein